MRYHYITLFEIIKLYFSYKTIPVIMSCVDTCPRYVRGFLFRMHSMCLYNFKINVNDSAIYLPMAYCREELGTCSQLMYCVVSVEGPQEGSTNECIMFV